MKTLPLSLGSLSLGAALLCSVAVAQPTTTTPPRATTPPASTTTMPPAVTTMPSTPGATMPARPLASVPGTTTGAPMGTTGTPGQLNPGNNASTTPPAVTTSNADQKTSAAPVRGRNSFTMGEARRRIERSGFTQVTGLTKDQNGIWRGKAMRGGQSVSVFCDYQGNVGGS